MSGLESADFMQVCGNEKQQRAEWMQQFQTAAQQQAIGSKPLTAAQHLEAARQSIAAALEIIGKVK